MLNTLVQPSSTWSPPVHSSSSKPSPVCPSKLSWEEHAANHDWELAILGFLRRDWRKVFRLWDVINQIIAASGQPNRSDVRSATREVLQTVMRLRRQRRVFRYRRKWLACLDVETPDVPGVKPTAVFIASNSKASYAYDLPKPKV